MIKKIFHFLIKNLSKKIISLDTNILEINLLIKKLNPIDTKFKLIRIGSKNDGGYLVPDDLSGIKTCFSPGTSDNCSFEFDLSEKYNIKSYMCDWTVEAPPIIDKNLIFRKKHLGVIDNYKFLTFKSWFNEIKPDADCILQMDIEGSEYGVLLDIENKILSKFRILIIEFHDLDMLFNQFGFNTINSVFEKLLLNFKVLHIHPNNCCGTFKKSGVEIPKVMEFTFLNNKRIKTYKKAKSFPNKLDFANTANKEIKLPEIWYCDK